MPRQATRRFVILFALLLVVLLLDPFTINLRSVIPFLIAFENIEFSEDVSQLISDNFVDFSLENLFCMLVVFATTWFSIDMLVQDDLSFEFYFVDDSVVLLLAFSTIDMMPVILSLNSFENFVFSVEVSLLLQFSFENFFCVFLVFADDLSSVKTESFLKERTNSINK